MEKYLLVLFFLTPIICNAQARRDTIQGVVVYTGPSGLISPGKYHTYTLEATEIKTDTGVISVRTAYGYLDLKKNYEFIPLNKLQPARLKRKP